MQHNTGDTKTDLAGEMEQLKAVCTLYDAFTDSWLDSTEYHQMQVTFSAQLLGK